MYIRAATRAGTVAVLVVTVLVRAEHLKRDAIDPPPPRTPASISFLETRSKRDAGGPTFYTDELTGFSVGSPRHAGSVRFCNRISAVVASSLRNRRGVLIVVTGTADGIPNSGLDIDLSDFPLECQRAVKPPIKDPDLALLRGCAIRSQLAQLVDLSATPIVFEQKIHDIPNGGAAGPQYRLVRVELQEEPANGR